MKIRSCQPKFQCVQESSLRCQNGTSSYLELGLSFRCPPFPDRLERYALVEVTNCHLKMGDQGAEGLPMTFDKVRRVIMQRENKHILCLEYIRLTY
jgi:hypothetical protein